MLGNTYGSQDRGLSTGKDEGIFHSVTRAMQSHNVSVMFATIPL